MESGITQDRPLHWRAGLPDDDFRGIAAHQNRRCAASHSFHEREMEISSSSLQVRFKRDTIRLAVPVRTSFMYNREAWEDAWPFVLGSVYAQS